MKAALRALNRRGPREVVAALSVAPPETARELAQEVDRVVCLERPLRFRALGYYYLSFPQPTDDEVTGTLHALESERMAPRGPG